MLFTENTYHTISHSQICEKFLLSAKSRTKSCELLHMYHIVIESHDVIYKRHEMRSDHSQIRNHGNPLVYYFTRRYYNMALSSSFIPLSFLS